MSLSRLEAALGHVFRNAAGLRQALTHRSFAASNNERLEFLGDSLLNCVIAAALYARFPDLPEGDLSRLRANLVKQDSLHAIAMSLDLGKQLQLGEGELRSGGHQRPSILADAVEALIGAVFLDAGFEAAQAVVLRLYAAQLAALTPEKPQKDPKTRLQEWLQARKKPLPRYAILDASGAAHEQRFEVACELDQPPLRTTGMGSSRRFAEQAAAEQALKALKA